MRAELYRPEEPEVVLASATWAGPSTRIEPAEGAPEGLEGVLRPTPIVVEDPSLRRLGTHGEALLQPGTLEWFRAALLVRAPQLGLAVRFVPGVREGGWDPASQYRSFEDQVERLGSSGS
jgi:hypothetical protein